MSRSPMSEQPQWCGGWQEGHPPLLGMSPHTLKGTLLGGVEKKGKFQENNINLSVYFCK